MQSFPTAIVVHGSPRVQGLVHVEVERDPTTMIFFSNLISWCDVMNHLISKLTHLDAKSNMTTRRQEENLRRQVEPFTDVIHPAVQLQV